MKNFSTILLAILLALSPICLIGCQSLQDATPAQRIERSIPYLRGSAIIITNGVFNYAVDEEDRKAKAQIVYDIALVIETMTAEGKIDINSVAELVSNYVPDKSHWSEFAASIIMIYADVHAQAQDLEDTSKTKVLAKALNAIAGGCKAASRVYLD